jgi:hypothetical protein
MWLRTEEANLKTENCRKFPVRLPEFYLQHSPTYRRLSTVHVETDDVNGHKGRQQHQPATAVVKSPAATDSG